MRVLIVGCLSGDLGAAARLALARGAKLAQADDVERALASLRLEAATDIVLCDLALDVAALLGAMAAERITVPVVVCGTDAQDGTAADAIRAGAREFLPLPPDPEAIAAILEAVARDRHTLIMSDPAMKACVRRAEQIAASEASALITGETGTGKEVLARYIHRHSRRQAGPFVALNCAAIPEHLLESELFGHEKGAFSGAVARRIGRIEAANGGTLLFDEIGELDLRLQAKLLRVVQEREVDRIGGASPVRVDVRILAATHRHLEEEVDRGAFRADLLFRLNVVSLRIPSLRERPGDIAVLAEYFARRFADLNAVQYRPLTASAVQLLQSHPWKGNIRELENVIHRAVLLCQDDAISDAFIEFAHASDRVAPQRGSEIGLDALVGRRMDEVEQEFILSTLRHTLGNRTHAATMLGISIRALRNKLRDYAHVGATVPPPNTAAMATLPLY